MRSLYVLFRVGDAEYVLPAAEVLQMDSYVGATPVPGTEAHVAGVVQVRGRVVPVIDLRVRFGLPPIERSLDSRVVVGELGPRTVGLLVDSAREVIYLDDDQMMAPPELLTQGAGFVRSIARADQRLVMVIDFDKVLGEELVDGQ